MVIHSKPMVTSISTIDILPDIPDPREAFNPANWMADAMRGARDQVIEWVEAGIANPPRISDDRAVQYFYQIALTPASYWSWLIIVWSIAVALLTFKAYGRIVYAFVVFFIVMAVSPVYIFLMNEMVGLGDDLTVALSGLHTSEMSESLDSIGNPILDLLSFGAVVAAAILTLGAFWSVDPSYTAMVFLIPLTFSVSAMGPRTRNVFNAFASIAIVIALVGRPVAQLVLEIFQFTIELQPGAQAVFVENLITASSLVIAVLIQGLLMFVCYSGIQRVQGAIASRISQIQSDVKTKVTNIVRMRRAENNSPRSTHGMRVVAAAKESPVRETVKREASSAVVNVGVTAAAIAAGAVTRNPKVAAIVYSGGKSAANFIRDNKKGERGAAAVQAGTNAARNYADKRKGKAKP